MKQGIKAEAETDPQQISHQALSEDNAEQSVSSNLKGTIKVACASNSKDRIDGHFGTCTQFLIYQVSPTSWHLCDTREPTQSQPGEDKNARRAELIQDCHLLFTVSIGGPAAAKVIRAGLHPMKLPLGGAAADVIERLRMTLASAPPPWLAKAMGVQPEQRSRLQDIDLQEEDLEEVDLREDDDLKEASGHD